MIDFPFFSPAAFSFDRPRQEKVCTIKLALHSDENFVILQKLFSGAGRGRQASGADSKATIYMIDAFTMLHIKSQTEKNLSSRSSSQ